MENIAFNEIISFDENSEFKRINEASAVEYFFTCSDDSIKKSFLDKFAIYIKKGLEARGFTTINMEDLMFIIYNLYDDPFPLLGNFNQLIEDISSDICEKYYKVNFSNIDTKKNIKNYFAIIDEIISDVRDFHTYRDFIISRELKKKLTMYRDDIEFAKRKEAFLNRYGDIDDEKLKKAFDYYVSKKYGWKKDNGGFLKDEGNGGNRCNRYEIYRYAYTYSLKTFSDEKTRSLFQLYGSKYIVAILESYDLNDILSVKRGFASNLYNTNTYDLSFTIFGTGKYQDVLKELFGKVNRSFENDFEQVILKYNQYKNYEIQTIIDEVDFPRFLESNCKSIKDYCDSKGIDISLFKKALGYLSDEVMIKQIEKKKQQLSSTRFAVINSKVDKIVDYMINGVPLDDNTTREFDYLDYKLMTKLELDEFKNLVCINGNTKGNADIVRVVSRFIGKNKNGRKTNIRSILDAKNIIGYGTDKEHEITDEEKLATIEYLKQHHLVSKNGVIDSKVYNLAIKRYLAGTLFTEEEKDKIKNKS